MAFILKSSKHTYKLLGFARQAIFTKTTKKFLFPENANFFKYNELCARTAATAMPQPVSITSFSIDKNISHLYGNLKASMVDLHVVEQTLKTIEQNNGVLTSPQLLLLLRCCGTAAFRDPEEKRIEVAKRIWNSAKELGTERDIVQCNTLLIVYNENNYKFAADEILSEIKQAGLEPNNVTYRHLLKAYCQEGNIKEAAKLLEEIKKKNYSINEYDFCSLIQGHCEAGDINEAEKILKVMKERGIQLTSDTYMYLLNGYAKRGDIEKIEAILDEVNKLELKMTATHLFNIVYTLIINNKSEHVDSVLSRIKKYNNDDKALMKIVHRLFHKKKDAEALKLFKMNVKMGYFPDYIQAQALGLVEHFVYNRSPAELITLCGIIEEEGWSTRAYSHALKKCVLRMPLEYCQNLIKDLKANGFPIRPHYFWPLIARYVELGNSGIIEVLKVMKFLNVPLCVHTVTMFMRTNYKFSGNWDFEIGNLKKYGVKECLASKIALYEALEKGKIDDAETIVSTYGIFRPDVELRNFLAKSFAKWCPGETNKFINILYCLAHDFYLYNLNTSEEVTEIEDNEDELNDLKWFYKSAITSLMYYCPENVFLNVLQNASKKKMIIPPPAAAAIRSRITNPDVDVILKDYVNADEFELNKDLLKKKSLNVLFSQKSHDPNSLVSLANKDHLKAEKLFEELGDKASLEDSLTIAYMYSKTNEFDKAFDVLDKLKSSQGMFDGNIRKLFRMTLHNLHKSGDIQKVINCHKMGVDLGIISEDYLHPVIRTILNSGDFDKAFEDYLPYFEKIKSVGIFLSVMDYLIPAQKTEAIEKMTLLFSQATNLNCALTALVTSYLANGRDTEARNVLEQKSFRFQNYVFLYWFNNIFLTSNKSFDEAMEVIKKLRPLDITKMYDVLLSKCVNENNWEDIKRLLVQCQEDEKIDPFFLEHLHQCVQSIEKNGNSLTDDLKFKSFSSRVRQNNNFYNEKIEDFLNANKSTDEMIEKLLLGKLPPQVVRKTLPLLVAEGKINELILIINKYRFGRLIPEIAVELLSRDKVEEFFNFLNSLESPKKYVGIYNSFAFQEERILNLVKTNHEFFEKFADISKRCYEEGKYEALLMFFIKLCIQSPDKLAKAEELLSTEDSRIESHFRNYCLSNMLLSSAQEIEFYKNVLENGKIKSVFSGALDHFYNRVINFYNENGDTNTALSYLNKAKEDGIEEKLGKRLLVSLKKNLDAQGTAFPYPYLLKEAV